MRKRSNSKSSIPSKLVIALRNGERSKSEIEDARKLLFYIFAKWLYNQLYVAEKVEV